MVENPLDILANVFAPGDKVGFIDAPDCHAEIVGYWQNGDYQIRYLDGLFDDLPDVLVAHHSTMILIDEEE